jgi:hypothetical protein
MQPKLCAWPRSAHGRSSRWPEPLILLALSVFFHASHRPGYCWRISFRKMEQRIERSQPPACLAALPCPQMRGTWGTQIQFISSCGDLATRPMS